MMRIDLAIVTILALNGELSSLTISEILSELGFWFVGARCWPALRRLEREGFIERNEHPGTVERGWRPKFTFKLARRARATEPK